MMDVGENIAFGLQRRGESRETIKKKVSAMLESVDLSGFDKKKLNNFLEASNKGWQLPDAWF